MNGENSLFLGDSASPESMLTGRPRVGWLDRNSIHLSSDDKKSEMTLSQVFVFNEDKKKRVLLASVP